MDSEAEEQQKILGWLDEIDNLSDLSSISSDEEWEFDPVRKPDAIYIFDGDDIEDEEVSTNS